jgi:hypothetical protein
MGNLCETSPAAELRGRWQGSLQAFRLAQDVSGVDTIRSKAIFTACWEAICDIVDFLGEEAGALPSLSMSVVLSDGCTPSEGR